MAADTQAQTLWEARYLLTRVEGELASVLSTGLLPSGPRKNQLLRCAEDLEHAAELLDHVQIRMPETLLTASRDWGNVTWLGPSRRRALSTDRDAVLRLEGAVLHRLEAIGAETDQPADLADASAEPWQRASNRRGRGAKVTAAG
ncbi:MAG: hypothetical protein KC912_03200 [Proteobacteria bacterium]|nr:hypothetical protein [Pseudomonadota bacterium]